MQLFIKNSIKFLLPVIILLIICEFSLRRIPNDYAYKSEFMESNMKDINVLILGNSHSFRGIRPAFIRGHAFNLAYVSQTLDVDCELIRKYRDRMPNLGAVIINISHPTLFSDIYASTESWRIKNYSIYMNLDKFKSIKSSFEITSSPMKININRILDYYFYNKTNLTCDSLGYGKYESKEKRSLEASGKQAAKRHTKNIFSLKTFVIFNRNKERLRELADWCKKKNIRLILYTPPAFKSYRQQLNERQLEMTLNFCKNLDDNYENVKYFNFLDADEFIESDFHNADHLNETGAQKLSIILDKQINE